MSAAASPPASGKRRWIRRLVVAALLATTGLSGFGLYRWSRAQAAGTLPTAPARQGEFLVIVRSRGELRARRSVQIIAPFNVPDLRIVWQAPPGGPVAEGDVVIRFDPSSAHQQLTEKEAGLRQAVATLDQAVAQAKIAAEQDRLDLAKARYEVERARLEASKAEIVSRLQAEESKIALGLAEQQLRVQEATVRLHEASARAKHASLTRVRDQANSEVELTKRRLSRMELKSPLSGVIVYMPNNSQGWMDAKPFKVGDQVWPGATVAEIPDLATLEMEAKLDEIERGRLSVGNPVRVRVDALPELSLAAKLESISPLTQQSFEWPPVRTFRGYVPLAKPDPRLRPAMNGSLDVIVNRLPDAISIPAKAVFTRLGKPIVYVLEQKRYRALEVEILARNPDEVAVKGLAAGTPVTLAEPDAKELAR